MNVPTDLVKTDQPMLTRRKGWKKPKAARASPAVSPPDGGAILITSSRSPGSHRVYVPQTNNQTSTLTRTKAASLRPSGVLIEAEARKRLRKNILQARRRLFREQQRHRVSLFRARALQAMVQHVKRRDGS